ncbi:hypothetical protein [Streptomyces sp. Wh19]|nr:hypothetical protein [Streptomyces sp. Wh19]
MSKITGKLRDVGKTVKRAKSIKEHQPWIFSEIGYPDALIAEWCR